MNFLFVICVCLDVRFGTSVLYILFSCYSVANLNINLVAVRNFMHIHLYRQSPSWILSKEFNMAAKKFNKNIFG